MTNWIHAGPTVVAAFLASLVEFVEAFTIVLAAGTVRGWRGAWAGVVAALVALVLIVLAGGSVLRAVSSRPVAVRGGHSALAVRHAVAAEVDTAGGWNHRAA